MIFEIETVTQIFGNQIILYNKIKYIIFLTLLFSSCIMPFLIATIITILNDQDIIKLSIDHQNLLILAIFITILFMCILPLQIMLLILSKLHQINILEFNIALNRIIDGL